MHPQWSYNVAMTQGDSERRIRSANVRWRVHPEDKELLEQAARADGRTVSNWLEHHALALARRQLEEATGAEDPRSTTPAFGLSRPEGA